MEEFLLFLQENWKWVLAIVLAVANLAVAIFRKKFKVVDSVKEFILKNLPLFISSAEKLFSSGCDKKNYVLTQISELLRIDFGVDVNDYIDFIDVAIEKILSTPQKKGVSTK